MKSFWARLDLWNSKECDLWPRWIFLRALGAIFFSAFYSLWFQIHGLIGARGILPVESYLATIVAALPGVKRLWYVPSLFWIDSSDRALTLVVAAGLLSSLLVIANVMPKLTIALSTLLFLTFIAAAPPKGYDGPPVFVANPVDHVATLIGTGTGGETVGEINNFPGATVPFGMVPKLPMVAIEIRLPKPIRAGKGNI